MYSGTHSLTGMLFYAVRGEGAYQATIDHPDVATKIQVDKSEKASEAIVLESVESGHTSHDASSIIQSTLNITKTSIRMDSQAKYGALARGQGSIYLRLPK